MREGVAQLEDGDAGLGGDRACFAIDLEHLVVVVELDHAAVCAADVGEGVAAADDLDALAALRCGADEVDDLLFGCRRLNARGAAAVSPAPVGPPGAGLGHHPRRSTSQASSTSPSRTTCMRSW